MPSSYATGGGVSLFLPAKKCRAHLFSGIGIESTSSPTIRSIDVAFDECGEQQIVDGAVDAP
jgi:hypothetical protein